MSFAGDSGAFEATNYGATENQNPVDIDTRTRKASLESGTAKERISNTCRITVLDFSFSRFQVVLMVDKQHIVGMIRFDRDMRRGETSRWKIDDGL